jgi:hypothetical protein
MNVTFDITENQRHYYECCARLRRTSVTVLCRRLLETIAQDQMVLAVLDDDSKPVDGRRYNYQTRRRANVHF